ncbi:MAG: hypothetical protein ABI639_09055 [Thermoanaerobaculia bacterium]
MALLRLKLPILKLFLCVAAFAPPVLALVVPLAPDASKSTPLTRTYEAPELAVEPTLDELGSLVALSPVDYPGLASFETSFGDDWVVSWDRRSSRPHLLQGTGVAIYPGSGNDLAPFEAGLSGDQTVTLEFVERRLRDFLAENPDLLRVSGFDLRLDPASSTAYGEGNTHWFLEFAQYQEGVRVEGANVFFRLNHGNLVQFGADRVSEVTTDTRPALPAGAAFAVALAEIGFSAQRATMEVVDAGSLHLYPTSSQNEGAGERFRGSEGSGYDHVLVWKFVFRLAGDSPTYQVLFDAHSNRILEVRDLNSYTDATVSGGIYPTTNSDPEVVVNFPFATVTNGGTKNTNAAGVYDYSGGTASIPLNGQYFRMSDACGAISLSSTTDGNLAFGTSTGTDCTTPGFGGAGNTHASRSGIYHLTNINRKAIGFLAGNVSASSWLNGKITANMNINQTCNAFWNGSTLNFYRSGGGCSNTGEIAAVFLHEWGHGMDTNSGGAASDQGTGEAVGDTFAFLETRDGCIGQNFTPGSNCANCTACTGVRDVSDFDLSGPAVIASPANVTHNSGINCDRFACPYTGSSGPYRGPMGYEGHCESLIASSANWDLTQGLIAQFGTDPGWSEMDRIWYGSLTPSKSAYRVTAGGTCNAGATVDGCAATNWYTVLLAADDNDGNLGNGTPNGCRIWDAYTAHGIACGARPVCSCTALPIANAGPDPAPICSATPTQIGTASQPGHTYLWSPGGATTAEITVSPATTTTYKVTATVAGCSSTTDSVTLQVSGTSAMANAGPDAAICPGGSVQIGTAPVAGQTYNWSPGGATTAEITVSPTDTTVYTVTATSSCSQATDSTTVTLTPAPVADAGPDATICEGSSVQLGTPAQPGLTYSWAPGGATTAQINVSPAATTVYTVTATSACSQATDSTTVTVQHAAIANAGNDLAICAGGSVQIGVAAIPGQTYSWSPGGATTAQVTVSPTDTTVYTVTATSNCTQATDSTTVSVGHPGASPALTSPADGALGVDPPILLAWQISPEATDYRVELALDAAFVDLISNTVVGNITSVNLGNIPVDQYFWRVTALGATCGNSAPSTVFDFTVDNVILLDNFESGGFTHWSSTVP